MKSVGNVMGMVLLAVALLAAVGRGFLYYVAYHAHGPETI